MAKRGGLRAELGGEAIYAWVIGEHLRDIKEASRNAQDGGRAYHAAVNEFLAYVSEDIGYYLPATVVKEGKVVENPDSWEVWQRKTLLDDRGRPLGPGARLTKAHRRMEVGHAVGILRRKGILGYKRTDFSDDAKALKAQLAARGPVDAEPDDEDEDA